MNNESHTMRIVQAFTKQYMMPFYRALLHTMDGITAHETTTHAKEQVCIVRGETRQRIKSEAVHGY
jgi:hypothetical protein